VGLESKAEQGDRDFLKFLPRCGNLIYGCFNTLGNPLGLGIVDFASHSYHTRLLWRFINNKPRVNGNAMTTHARARLENVDAWMMVCELNEFPDINVEAVADQRKLVCKSNVNVTKCILSEFGHFCRPCI